MGTQPGLRELPLTQQESHGDTKEGDTGGLCAEQAAPTDQPSPEDGGRPLTDPPADHGHQWGCMGKEAELGAQRAQIPLTPTLQILIRSPSAFSSPGEQPQSFSTSGVAPGPTISAARCWAFSSSSLELGSPALHAALQMGASPGHNTGEKHLTPTAGQLSPREPLALASWARCRLVVNC